MAARSPKAGIDLTVNEAPAAAGLKRLAKNFGETAVQINQAAELAQKAWGALTMVVGGVVGALVETTKLAMEQERVERRAIAAIQSKTDLTRAEYEALQEANRARQNALGINDREQLQLQGTLAAMGVRKEQLDAATEATIGLAQVTGGELAEAGKAVAKALTGDAAALKEYGIVATDAADAQRKLAETFALAKAQSDSLEVKVQALQAAWGDMQETIGTAVSRSGAAKDITDALTQSVSEFTSYLASDEGRKAVDEFFRFIALSVANALDAFEGMRKAGRDLITWFKLNFGSEPVAESLAPPQETWAERMANRLRAIAVAPARVDDPLSALERPSRAKPNGMSGAAAKNRRTGADMMVGAVELFRQEQEREKTAKEQAARIMELNAQLAEMEAKSKLELRAIEAQAEMEQQREQVERRNALLIEAYQMRLELHREMSTAELEQRVTAHRAVIEAEERQADTLKQLAGATIDTFGQQFAQMVAQVASGEVSMSEALSGFVRAILTQVGTMLISTGTAALVLQALSFIPGLWGITGPPGMGIGPAIAAIGVGTAMVAGASFISGGARANAGGGASARGATAPRGPSMGDVVPRGFAALAGASASPYVVNISFSGVVGDERRAARMIEDVLRRGR